MSTLTEAETAYYQNVRKKSDILWAWSQEQTLAASIVIAMRIGFRALPFVVQEPVGARFTPKQCRETVCAFRYIALGRLNTRRPNWSLDAFATLLNTIAYVRMSAARAAIFEAFAASSGNLVDMSRAQLAQMVASRASSAAMRSAMSPVNEPWGAIAADQTYIEAGGDPMVLLDQPMWLDPKLSGGVPEPHASRWNVMRAALDSEDETWRVWTAWYQDRLRGAPAPTDAIEYLRITLMPNAMTRAEDPSSDALERWTADIEGNRGLLKGSPRKANRVAATLINELESAQS